jgi:hypothetical protein
MVAGARRWPNTVQDAQTQTCSSQPLTYSIRGGGLLWRSRGWSGFARNFVTERSSASQSRSPTKAPKDHQQCTSAPLEFFKQTQEEISQAPWADQAMGRARAARALAAAIAVCLACAVLHPAAAQLDHGAAQLRHRGLEELVASCARARKRFSRSGGACEVVPASAGPGRV